MLNVDGDSGGKRDHALSYFNHEYHHSFSKLYLSKIMSPLNIIVDDNLTAMEKKEASVEIYRRNSFNNKWGKIDYVHHIASIFNVLGSLNYTIDAKIVAQMLRYLLYAGSSNDNSNSFLMKSHPINISYIVKGLGEVVAKGKIYNNPYLDESVDSVSNENESGSSFGKSTA